MGEGCVPQLQGEDVPTGEIHGPGQGRRPRGAERFGIRIANSAFLSSYRAPLQECEEEPILGCFTFLSQPEGCQLLEASKTIGAQVHVPPPELGPRVRKLSLCISQH